MKLDKFKGCVFFGKIQKRICDLRSMDYSASKKRKIRKRIIFHDNANQETQSCVQFEKKKKSCLTGLFWRNSSTKMPPEKKIP